MPVPNRRRKRRILPALLILLSLAAPLAAQRPSAVNRLYQYEAELREAVESPVPSLTPLAPWSAPRVTLERALKGRDENGAKLALDKGEALALLGPREMEIRRFFSRKRVEGWSLRREDGSVAWLPGGALGTDRLLETWNRARGMRAADSLTQVRGLRFVLRQRATGERELAAVDELARRYRERKGPHRQMDPVALLRAEQRPDPADPRWWLPLAWEDGLALSGEPWGAALPTRSPDPGAPWPVLEYAGAVDGAWRIEADSLSRASLGLPAEGPLWITAELLPDEALGGAALQLRAIARDDADRALNARRHRLLQRWKPDEVERVLTGLAWVGMDREMLLESLGEPARREATASGETWTYAEGNRVLLSAGKVVGIQQP